MVLHDRGPRGPAERSDSLLGWNAAFRRGCAHPPPAAPNRRLGPHGKFTLEDVPSGAQTLRIDGSQAKQEGSFGVLTLPVYLPPGEETTLPRPIFLTAADSQSATLVQPTTGTLVTFQERIPGLGLSMEANSLTMPDGSSQGSLTATEITLNRLPGRLADGSIPSALIRLEPSGTRIQPPARLTFPNRDGLAPGTRILLFAYESGPAEQRELGTGHRQPGWIENCFPIKRFWMASRLWGYRPDYVTAAAFDAVPRRAE